MNQKLEKAITEREKAAADAERYEALLSKARKKLKELDAKITVMRDEELLTIIRENNITAEMLEKAFVKTKVAESEE
ncbi:MAG: hypothetical protein IJK60_07985 [Clostridia bacterium]|nr:hypothetical protein [Clostridia bacterium]